MTENYTNRIESSLRLDRPLLPQHLAYLDRFVQTRRATYSVEHLQNIPDPLREAVNLPLGPEGTLVFDEYLFSFSQDHGISAWDVMTGERVLSDPDFHATRYHPKTKQFLHIDEQNGSVIIGTFTQ